MNPHISLNQNMSTCIDLIMTDKEESFVDSGTIFSPDSRCEHNIIHGTINFGIPPPPPYQRRVWQFHQANIGKINDDLPYINWVFEFSVRTVDECVDFSQTKYLLLWKVVYLTTLLLFEKTMHHG